VVIGFFDYALYIGGVIYSLLPSNGHIIPPHQFIKFCDAKCYVYMSFICVNDNSIKGSEQNTKLLG